MEEGGLAVRSPLPAVITYQMRHSSPPSEWGGRLLQRLRADLPSLEEGEEERWMGNTVYCYRKAEGMVEEVMSSVAARATNGRIQMGSLPPHEQQLVALFAAAQQEWQQVCLVLSVKDGSNTAVAINRPLAKAVNRPLAELLLNGEKGSTPPKFDESMVDKCVRAFGGQSGVYVGGPKRQREPALLVHGLPLEGSEEIAPGTRIYTGGEEAAIEGVLRGEYSPLDFRWFVGRQEKLHTSTGEWRTLACARPVALKQCLGLPKPLWHEVLELCGGELAELSRMELLKRDDLES
ncbi:MAG: hypothetical protein SGPRY_012512 [Prymnesium sp.]